MGLIQRAKQQTQPKPTPVVVPEPIAVPEVVEPTTNAVTTFDPFALLNGAVADACDATLNAVMEIAENSGPKGGFDGPFALVNLSGGANGGNWVFGENVQEAEMAALPSAKKAFVAMFLGVRIRGAGWPQKYDQNATDVKPLWDVEISSGSTDLFSLAIKAGEAYQYTKKDPKDKFDPYGHFRPGVEFLFYRKGVVFAVRLPEHATSTMRALQALGQVMANLGGMKAVPLRVEPYSTQEKGKTQWSCHSVRIEAALSAEGKEVQKDYADIRAQLLADEDFKQAFTEWNTTKVSPEAEAGLRGAAALAK